MAAMPKSLTRTIRFDVSAADSLPRRLEWRLRLLQWLAGMLRIQIQIKVIHGEK